MSFREQKKYFEILPRYLRKFNSAELEGFKKLAKRNKEDEELDKLALNTLQTLFEKYHINREKPNFDHLFKSDNETNSEETE